jgi:calpain-15
MTCTASPVDIEIENYGIVPGNIYTIDSVQEILNKYGNRVRLLKIRNPWNEGEWNGRWSDNSETWTDEIRE